MITTAVDVFTKFFRRFFARSLAQFFLKMQLTSPRSIWSENRRNPSHPRDVWALWSFARFRTFRVNLTFGSVFVVFGTFWHAAWSAWLSCWSCWAIASMAAFVFVSIYVEFEQSKRVQTTPNRSEQTQKRGKTCENFKKTSRKLRKFCHGAPSLLILYHLIFPGPGVRPP